MRLLQNGLKILLCAAVLVFIAFLIGRYGWKLFGFTACESAGIESVEVSANEVTITGFYPGSFPRGFLGYHAEEENGILYVGFKFSGLFGIFEAGDFNITIPVKGEIREVIIKTKNYEYPVWPELGSTVDLPTDPGTGAFEDGLYVLLERSDVHSVNWHFESRSGGITSADHSAMNTGEYLYLDNDIQWAAGNLERPVPFMLVFSDSTGATIAQANMVYDPENPVLIVTLTSDGKILVNGIEAEEPAIPVPYEEILAQYRNAISEGWDGQQLVDAGLNHMIRDVESGTVGYSVDDLDGDGVPEFAIGTLSEDEFYGKLIFALYTQDKHGNAVQLFSSIERDRYYYAGGVRFANIGSSGADNSYVTTLKLEGEGLVDMTFTTDPKDYVQMQFVPIAESKENSKATSENAAEIIYEGEYASYDTDEPMLYIQKNKDGTYSIQIGIYRLIQLDKCVGIDKGNRLEFTTVELGENQEITGTIVLNAEVAAVTLYAPWSDTWFKDVNEFDYYKLNVGNR